MPVELYDFYIQKNISDKEIFTGTVRLSITDAESADIKKVTVSYRPNAHSSAPLDTMFIGLATPDGGLGLDMEHNKETGEFTAEIEMLQTQANVFSLHANVTTKSEFNRIGEMEVFRENIVLVNHKLITQYYDKGAEEGHIEKMIFNGKTLERLGVDKNPDLKAGEEIVSVYFPYGHKISTEPEKYNLQVFLDGEMLLDGDPFGNKIAGKTLFDNLISTGKIGPTVVVFVEPKKPTPTEANKDKSGEERWEGAEMPRLRQNACDTETHDRLVELPAALRAIEPEITSDPTRTCISGFSMTGLQALYTSIRRPDVYANVSAHSPSLWWGPNESRSIHNEPARPVTFNDDETWRAPLNNNSQQQYLLEMVSTSHDKISNTDLPDIKPKIFLQAGTYEDGNHGADEPLVQATLAFGKKIGVTPLTHHGGHNAPSWSAGLSEAIPMMHAKLDDKKVLSSGDIASSFKTVRTEEKVKSPRISKGAT